jgi:hypothetical protein
VRDARSSVCSLLAALALPGCGCGGDVTQIVVVVDSDLVAPDEIARIEVHVEGPTMDADAVGSLGGCDDLPVTVALVPGSDAAGPIRIEAVGIGPTAGGVSQAFVTEFVPGESRMLRIELSRSCLTTDCPSGLTCANGSCRSERFEGVSLPQWSGRVGRGDRCNGDGGVTDGGPCGVGFLRCGGRCVPESVENCGRCGRECGPAENAVLTCEAGECVVGLCANGRGDCNDDPSDGCEVRPMVDDLLGGDHCKADWILSDGAVVAGNHVNISSFVVQPGALVRVRPLEGESYGTFGVEARAIRIEGTLDASGSGHRGGNGGAGASSGSPHYCGSHGAEGAAGNGGFGGGAGTAGPGHGGDDSMASGCRSANGQGGGPGGPGGYLAPAMNGDMSADDSLSMGSGGGGGGGGGSGSRYGSNDNYPAGTGGGGGGGGRGGGVIRLTATEDVTVNGAVLASGGLGGDGGGGERPSPCAGRFSDPAGGGGGSGEALGSGRGGPGACQDEMCEGGLTGTCGGNGGAGGPGAGGGVLLRGRRVMVTGRVDTRGGNGRPDNGGTLKVLHQCGHSPGSYETGRTFELMEPGPPCM